MAFRNPRLARCGNREPTSSAIRRRRSMPRRAPGNRIGPIPLITVTVFTRCARRERAARAYGVPPEIPIRLKSSSRRALATSSTSGTDSRAVLRSTNSERPTPGRFGAMIRRPIPSGLLGDVGCLMMRADQAVEEEGRMPRGIAVLGDFELPSVSHHEQVLSGRLSAGVPGMRNQGVVDPPMVKRVSTVSSAGAASSRKQKSEIRDTNMNREDHAALKAFVSSFAPRKATLVLCQVPRRRLENLCANQEFGDCRTGWACFGARPRARCVAARGGIAYNRS